MADTAPSYGIPAERRDGYPGCWVDPLGRDGPPRKLGALGLRVEKGVTYHGIALNVTTDLADFELIDACGLTGHLGHVHRPELGWTGERADTVDGQRAGRRRAVRSCVRASPGRGGRGKRRAPRHPRALTSA